VFCLGHSVAGAPSLDKSSFSPQDQSPLPYIVQSWQTEHGLPQNYVTSIAQTTDGYLWIGTYNGLARFDGVRFVTYDPDSMPELRHAHVQRVLADPRGSLWISTAGNGLTSWREGRFRFEWRGTTAAGGVRRLLLSRSNEVLFSLSSGQLLRGTLTAAGSNRWEVIAAGREAVEVHVHRDGTVVGRTSEGQLILLRGDHFRLLPADIGLRGENVRTLLTDNAGRLWVGTEKEVAVWDADEAFWGSRGATHRFLNMTPTNGEPELSVSSIVAVGDGSLWVSANGRTRRCRGRQWLAEAKWKSKPPVSGASYYGDSEAGMWVHFGSGLLHVRPDGQVHHITTEHGLANDRVASWFQDHENNVWVGLNRGGLVRLRPRHFQVLGASEGLSDQVAMSVCEDHEGAIWIGTYGGGLNRWENGVFRHFNLGSSNTPGIVVAVCSDLTGRVWIGTAGNGVWVHEQGVFKQPFSSEPMEDRAYAIFADRRGRIWMGNRRGLFCWDAGELKHFGAAEGVPSTDVRALAEDADGAIWIGATDGAIYRFADRQFDRFRVPDGRGHQPVYSLLPDNDGTLWIGTFRGGLLRFKDGKWVRYTTREGLPNNVICHILDDGRGQLWMSSHQGIFRVAKEALHAYARAESSSVACVAYGSFDGLPTVECTGNYQPAAWRARDGRLWFATVKGVVSVQPGEVTLNRLPPPVVIEEVLVDGVPSEAGGQVGKRGSGKVSHAAMKLSPTGPLSHLPACTLRVRPGRHHIEFRFTGLSLSAPDKTQFQYMLEGLDRDWLDCGTKRTASYSYVPAGTYRFRVRACNNDGVWNRTGPSLGLIVPPYFWQTWWFAALSALTVFGTVGGTIRFVETRKLQRRLERLERERAVERERARIAGDIHDDLGASLTRITLLSESARDSRNGTGRAGPEIDQIYSTARELTRAMDEIVWAVDPQHDTLDSLATYLGKFAQDYLRAAGVRCRLDMPMHLPVLPLTSEMRHNLFLAFKEALHNTVKHSGASEVRVRLAVHPHQFTLSVEDDGRGLGSITPRHPGAKGPSSRLATGHGLTNMRRRLEQIGGRCEWVDCAEAGTRVRFVVPVKPHQ